MNDRLTGWRSQIDILDKKILKLLAQRVNLVKKIGKYKKEHRLPVVDTQRWSMVLKLCCKEAESLNLSKDFIKKLFIVIYKYSVMTQKADK